ncbi:hypothetical protein HMPREF1548_05468 [Clostridium sp. KLE 1755]|nr:hypothetical protein HMPREF1548_05468 [Clostridium sp. KLE 1755]
MGGECRAVINIRIPAAARRVTPCFTLLFQLSIHKRLTLMKRQTDGNSSDH